MLEKGAMMNLVLVNYFKISLKRTAKYVGMVLSVAFGSSLCADHYSDEVKKEPPTLSQKNDKNFYYELEALLWQPAEKSVVVTNHYAPVLTTTDFTENTVSHPHLKWDWGFRIGVGSYFVRPNWSVDLYWTRFSTADSQHKETSTNDVTHIDQQGSFPIWNIANSTIAQDYVNNSDLR